MIQEYTGYILIICPATMKELTSIVWIVNFIFLLSSANSQQSECEKCAKFTLDSIDEFQGRVFSGQATCCVKTLDPWEGTYAQENNISDLDAFPSKVHKNDIQMSVYYNASNDYKPVVKISWTYPLCRKGAMKIKGFNINVSTHTGTYVEKRMLFSNAVNYMNKEDRLSIEYDFSNEILPNNTDFSVVIGSIPEDKWSRPDNYEEVRGNTGPLKSSKKRHTKEPIGMSSDQSQSLLRMRRSSGTKLQQEINNWRSEWRLSNSTEDKQLYTIKIHFLQASCEYNFDYYRFRICNCTDEKFTSCSCDIQKHFGSTKCSDDLTPCVMEEYKDTTITFRNIVPGNYKIIFATNVKSGALDKKFIRRNDFPIEDFTSVPHVSPTTSPGPITGSAIQGGDESRGTEIAAILAGTMIGLFLIAGIGLVCFWQKRRKRNYTRHFPSASSTFDSTPINNQESTRQLQRKRVTIVNSTDHPLHHICVKLLAHFLKTKCYCDISWEANDLQQLMCSKSEYILSSLGDDADFVMVIHSEGAYRKYKMLKDTKDARTYESKKYESVAGDFFVQALSTLKCLATQPNKRKLINAHFSYTSDKFLIDDLRKDTPVYSLMDKIDKVCMHIHGINEQHELFGDIKENYDTLPFSNDLKEQMEKFKEIQKVDPDWFARDHQISPHGNNPTVREPDISPPEQCDSGLGGETTISGVQPYYDDPNLHDNSLANSSLFPHSPFDLPQFFAPADLHEGAQGARPKVRNNRVNEKPLNNAVNVPSHLNVNDNRLATPLAINSNSSTLPLSHRNPEQGLASEPWGAYPSTQSYPSPPTANNPTQNPRKPVHLPNSRNSSIRNNPLKSRNLSGGSNRSNVSSKGPASRQPSVRSDVSSNINLPYVPSLPIPSAEPSPRGAEAAPSEFAPPEDMSFCGPAMSDDTSSIDSRQQELELRQINDEFDYNNGGDSGTCSIDGEFKFHRPDDFDQVSV